jgi:hypothetical protein
MSRDSGTGEMIDLSRYTVDMLEYLVSGFDKARLTYPVVVSVDSQNTAHLRKRINEQRRLEDSSLHQIISI